MARLSKEKGLDLLALASAGGLIASLVAGRCDLAFLIAALWGALYWWESR